VSKHFNLEFDLQRACDNAHIPADSMISTWLHTTLSSVAEHLLHSTDIMLSLRIVDISEMQALNHQFRQKTKPTNVLSFPNTDYAIEPQLDRSIPHSIPWDNEYYLGDIILCAPIIEQEAKDQNKSLEHHWAHMIVHGVLHLLGYDHVEEKQAEEMESLEISILQKIGFSNPYALDNLDNNEEIQ